VLEGVEEASEVFFAADRFVEVTHMLAGDIRAVGTRAGGLTKEMAALTGLKAGTPVAVAVIDAHNAVPACGVTEPGKLVTILGASAGHMLLDHRHQIPGVAGVVKNGIVPGFYGYESGQAAVGDLFAWFHEFLGHPSSGELQGKAAALPPGTGGVLALDWWNGTALPQHVYRALIEATAFGTRRIVESFARGGMAVHEIYACGSVAEKNRLLLQVIADAAGRTVRVARSAQASALGAAIFGAVAAGFGSVADVAQRMAGQPAETYKPRRNYDRFFAQYERLAEQYGRFDNLLRELKRQKWPQRHREGFLCVLCVSVVPN
jgi:L-ribulokinase